MIPVILMYIFSISTDVHAHNIVTINQAKYIGKAFITDLDEESVRGLFCYGYSVHIVR